MTEVIQISKETMDGIRYRARRKAMEENKKRNEIKISPAMKKVLSKVKKTCGRC